jgi:hypothetical protein
MAELAREDPQVRRPNPAEVGQRLRHAGETLAMRQVAGGPHRGNVPAWPGNEDLDFHGTLAAIWIWARASALAQTDAFAGQLAAAWSFVVDAWPRFVPATLDPVAGDEAPYDCALVLRAALADRAGAARQDVRGLPESAARLLAAYLTDLEDVSGREFQDPGFLAWNVLEYGRASSDRGLLSTARRFVDRAFGMKAPTPFGAEPALAEGMFDFSSTTAMRVLAVLAAEGNTPLMAAWLHERVAPHVPGGFVARPLDENCWNACVATALGRAYLAASDSVFLRGHAALCGELESRLGGMTGTLGRQPGHEDETAATFYFALALDAALRP